MAAHAWVDHPPDHPHQRLLADPQRRCTRCGAIQHQETEYWWGRVAARRWRPLVGRCPGPAFICARVRERGNSMRPIALLDADGRVIAEEHVPGLSAARARLAELQRLYPSAQLTGVRL